MSTFFTASRTHARLEVFQTCNMKTRPAKKDYQKTPYPSRHSLQISSSQSPYLPVSFFPPRSLLVKTSLLVRFPTPSSAPPFSNCPVTPLFTPSCTASTFLSPVILVLFSWSAQVSNAFLKAFQITDPQQHSWSCFFQTRQDTCPRPRASSSHTACCSSSLRSPCSGRSATNGVYQ